MPQPAEDVAALLLEVNHEVGNLLASARMSTYLLARQVEGAGRERVAEVERLVGLVGALVAQTRPLLGEANPTRVHPGDVCEGVRSALGPEVDLRCPAGVPAIRADADALVAILAGLVQRAQIAKLDACVDVRTEGDAVVFRVPTGGGAEDGRPLAARLAIALVTRMGGRVEASSAALDLRFPVLDR